MSQTLRERITSTGKSIHDPSTQAVFIDVLQEAGQSYGDYLAHTQAAHAAVLTGDFEKAVEIRAKSRQLLRTQIAHWVAPLAKRFSKKVILDSFGAIRGLEFAGLSELRKYLTAGGHIEFERSGYDTLVLNGSLPHSRAFPARSLAEVLKWPSLRHLSLVKVRLDEAGAEHLSRAKQLRGLELDLVQLPDGKSNALAEILKDSSLIGLQIRNLINGNLTALSALGANKQLKRLVIYENHLTIDHLKAISGARSLIDLSIGADLPPSELLEITVIPELEIFAFDTAGWSGNRRNQIKGWNAVISALLKNPTLRSLYLWGAEIGITAAKALRNSTTLKELSLNGNDLSRWMPMLASNAGLEILRMDQSVPDLRGLEAIHKNSRLKVAEFSSFGMSEEAYEKMRNGPPRPPLTDPRYLIRFEKLRLEAKIFP